ncbi:MAG: MFS transporter [Clostridia bacterium]|nr:MFS transporter [Clostridia bacterium]
MKTKAFFTECRDFLLLWSSQTISSLGTEMTAYALNVWVYSQHGTASSLSLLTLCTFLPTILFRFIAGTLADRWNKKRIMLAADAFAASGTLLILVLHSMGWLRIWHLYVINTLLSLMNAFQVPASYVATSLLVPEKHYARAGGLQGLAGSVLSILAPALGSMVLALGGLTLVLWLDLSTFAIAFGTLLLAIHLPEKPRQGKQERKPFWQECTAGLVFLKERKPLWRLILFFTAINFLAKIGGDGQMAAFVLARSNGSQQALGLVQAAVSMGIMAGSLLMTWLKPAKDRFAAVYLTCGMIFLGDIVQGLSVSIPVWVAAAFGTYLIAAVMNVHLTVLMRESVPIEMQGRVFSARDTLQNGFIPLGLLTGGWLADHIFEPFMSRPSIIQAWLIHWFSGNGAGIALLFFLTGLAGAALSLIAFGFFHAKAPEN